MLAAALAATDAARQKSAYEFGCGEIDMDEFMRRQVEITHRERLALQDAVDGAAALLRRWSNRRKEQ